MLTCLFKKRTDSATTRKSIIQASEREIRYDNEVKLRKETEAALAREKEQVVKLRLLLKINQELEKVKGLIESYRINVSEMQEERDNALELVHESITTKITKAFFCPISHEVMKDPQMTSDGYTYEAEAIKEWINNVHDTSPMTNLKLSHTQLVPNRALRSAIHDLV